MYLTDWTTLFVGYSLLDYNLRLLFKTLRWKIDSANLERVLSSRDGTFIVTRIRGALGFGPI